MKPTQVHIPTTDGPSQVERIAEEDPLVRSVVCLNRTTEALPISGGYDAFVRKPTGIIEKQFGHPTFRVDLTTRITGGASWQLGIFTAHALHEKKLLASPRESAQRAVWMSGEVDRDLEVRPVSHIPEKLAASRQLFQEWQETGIQSLLILPEANARELDWNLLAEMGVGRDQVVGVNHVSEALGVLDMTLPGEAPSVAPTVAAGVLPASLLATTPAAAANGPLDETIEPLAESSQALTDANAFLSQRTEPIFEGDETLSGISEPLEKASQSPPPPIQPPSPSADIDTPNKIPATGQKLGLWKAAAWMAVLATLSGASWMGGVGEWESLRRSGQFLTLQAAFKSVEQGSCQSCQLLLTSYQTVLARFRPQPNRLALTATEKRISPDNPCPDSLEKTQQHPIGVTEAGRFQDSPQAGLCGITYQVSQSGAPVHLRVGLFGEVAEAASQLDPPHFSADQLIANQEEATLPLALSPPVEDAQTKSQAILVAAAHQPVTEVLEWLSGEMRQNDIQPGTPGWNDIRAQAEKAGVTIVWAPHTLTIEPPSMALAKSTLPPPPANTLPEPQPVTATENPPAQSPNRQAEESAETVTTASQQTEPSTPAPLPSEQTSPTNLAAIAAAIAPIEIAPPDSPESSSQAVILLPEPVSGATLKPAQQIAQLLSQAEADMAAKRLTKPVGGSAFDRFQEVLALDPNQATAKLGMAQIVDRYIAMAEKAQDEQRFGDAESYLERAYMVYATANGFDPETDLKRAASVYSDRFDPENEETSAMALLDPEVENEGAWPGDDAGGWDDHNDWGSGDEDGWEEDDHDGDWQDGEDGEEAPLHIHITPEPTPEPDFSSEYGRNHSHFDPPSRDPAFNRPRGNNRPPRRQQERPPPRPIWP
ncbi:MAG: hypothetical protein HQL52_05530 [Magnetococcales bacterium]|nr:hypothetical protein [Magnetococcales bacterium]